MSYKGDEGKQLLEMSDRQERGLLQKVMEFQVDVDGDVLPFSARLCRENQWHETFAQRCIVEYKRFLFLVLRSKQELTPSDQVDQVWHLHLLYTKSYWIDLCQSTLASPLHHLPTKGGGSELSRFRDQYQATLQCYREYFGAEPPPDIWPSVNDRFRDADAFVRTNKARYWLIRKPADWLIMAVSASLFLVACTQSDGDSDFWYYAKWGLGLFALYKIVKWLGEKGGRGGGGCSGVGCGGCSGCGG